MSLTITLIHGTWAPERIRGRNHPEALRYPTKGGWPLATAIVARYPTAEPYLLRWSGGNSVRDRRRAASAVVRHVRAIHRQKPGGVHILIGHSHGGTVAYYALAAAVLRQRLAGVVCLSTPFVTFSRRSVTDTRILQFTLFLIALLPLVLLSGGGDALWVPLTLTDAVSPTPVPPTADPTWQEIAVAVAGLGLLLGARPAWQRMQGAAVRFLRRAALPDLASESVPMMLVRSPSDEASGGLAASQFIAWALLQLGRRILTPFARTVGPTPSSPRQLGAAVLPMLVVTTVVALVGAGIGYALQREVSLPIVPLLIVFLLPVPLLMLAFSRDTAAHSLFLHTSVEPCPPGRWEVHQLGPDIPAQARGGAQAHGAPEAKWRVLWERVWRVLQWNALNPFQWQGERTEAPAPPLMHSLTYQDARAVELVTAFVESRIAAGALTVQQT